MYDPQDEINADATDLTVTAIEVWCKGMKHTLKEGQGARYLNTWRACGHRAPCSLTSQISLIVVVARTALIIAIAVVALIAALIALAQIFECEV